MAGENERTGEQGDQEERDQEEREERDQGERDQEERKEERDQEARDEEGEQEDGDQDKGEQEDGDRRDARPSISAREMTRAAMEALEELTGHEPEAATGLMWDGDSWLVTVDVLELSRIPETTDLLATYVVQLDGDGNLSGYKRTKRFQRSQADEG
jgi:hypothetical protein